MIDRVDSKVLERMARSLLDHLAGREGGHCAVVRGLVGDYAHTLATLAHEASPTDDHLFLVSKDAIRDYEITPTRAVEERNNAGDQGFKLCLISPTRTAVDDSLDATTFEVINTSSGSPLSQSTRNSLANDLSGEIQDTADRVLSFATGGSTEDAWGSLRFIARLALADDAETELGLALTELGLLPDSRIRSSATDADLERYLSHNSSMIAALTEMHPVAERLRLLPASVPDSWFEVLSDAFRRTGSTRDRLALTRALDQAEQPVPLDLADVDIKSGGIDELRVLRFTKDIVNEDGWVVKNKPSVLLGFRARCVPPPKSVMGLKEIIVRLLQVTPDGEDIPTGYEKTYRPPLPASTEFEKSIRVPKDSLDPGQYRFQLVAYGEQNEILANHTSPEPFAVGDEPIPLETEACRDVDSATVLAIADGISRVQPPQTAIQFSDSRPIAKISVEYPDIGKQWTIEYPRILWNLERSTIEDPSLFGRYIIDLGDPVPGDTAAKETDKIPVAVQEARTSLMEQVLQHQFSETEYPTLAFCDLGRIRDAAEHYCSAWASALFDNLGNPSVIHELLAVDHVAVRGLPGDARVRLVGPFHPLRLAWRLGHHQFLRAARDHIDPEMATQARQWLARFSADNVPPLASDPQDGWFRYTEYLAGDWALFLSPDSAEAQRTSTTVRQWLGLDRSELSKIKATDIRRRIERYVASHPYVEQVLINVIRPGDGRVVLDALVDAAETPGTDALRFVVRLFDDAEPHQFGHAFDSFMSGEDDAYKKSAADRFRTAADSVLYSALTYSKHPIDGIINDPSDYPAHLSIFLDHFRTTVQAVPATSHRSIFFDGLMIRPSLVFDIGSDDADPAWNEIVSASSATTSLIGLCLGAFNSAVVSRIPGSIPEYEPALRLCLRERDQRLLSAVHDGSDWVVVIDPTFSDAYLDRPSSADVNGNANATYLLDHATEPDRVAARHITVSTRSRDYMYGFVRPMAERLGLELDDKGAARILRGLNALGAGLVLRLIDRNTKALESLTLGVASLYLEATGVLRHALVIPLDLYQGLFGSAVTPTARRADLLLVRPHPSERRFETAIVEVKGRSNLNGAVPSALVDDVTDQLTRTRESLMATLFGKSTSTLEQAATTDRLRLLLRSHLERAERFNTLDRSEVDATSQFLDSLDEGYSIDGPALIALVFDLTGQGHERVEADNGSEKLTAWRIGRDLITRLVGADINPADTAPLVDAGDFNLDAIFADASTTSRVTAPLSTGITAGAHDVNGVDEPEEKAPPNHNEVTTDQRPPANILGPSRFAGPDRSELAFIGSATAKQFGIVGEIIRPRRAVAFDTDNTSVVSVFGAQGSGKSYTVGALLEAALIPDPHLTELARPLSGVVFHYSQDPSYAPEYISMVSANDDPQSIARLESLGVTARGLESVTVLTSPSTVEQRRAEMPGCTVEPLQIGTSELTADHWRLLMGLDGGTQMYAKELGRILDSLRSNVTFETLENAIEESNLPEAQKRLTRLRIGFLEGFVADEGDVSRFLAPGDLLIIDLRDEYVDKNQALALFMVVLDLLTGRDDVEARGNKVVVFDEAHKYIESGPLIDRLTAKIREMRHLGTTVIIASQDPPSLPFKVVELSTVLIAHRFTSPQWLKHLERYSAGFAEHAPQVSQFARLEPGQAFVYATVGDDAFERPQKMQFRPRLTRHGGATRRATDD